MEPERERERESVCERKGRPCLRREHGDTDGGISRCNNIIVSGAWTREIVHPVLGSRGLTDPHATADANSAAVRGFLQQPGDRIENR